MTEPGHLAPSAHLTEPEHCAESAHPTEPASPVEPERLTGFAEPAHPAFDSFVETVAKLRSPDGGCPWNRAQTHASLGEYLIEEAYEALDAIEDNNPDHLREELGDVLLQVVLNSQVAADAGEFTIDDVCETINEKMIRRHPHVFGGVKAENANEVADLWEQVKLAEKAAKAKQTERKPVAGSDENSSRVAGETGETRLAANEPKPTNRTGSDAGMADSALEDSQEPSTSEHEHLLDSVPVHFPALLQAQKISRKAVAAGFEWETLDDVWDKVAEERSELEAAYAAAPKTSDGRILAGDASDYDPRIDAAELEFGDLLFALVNVARKMGIDAESALRASNAKFRKRFARVEEAAWHDGREVEDLTIDEMEEHWQNAKRYERP